MRISAVNFMLLNCFFSIIAFPALAQIIDCPKPVVVGRYKDQANMYQVIYPFGWSERGDFAYILQDVNTSNFSYKVIIQNMKTDKIIWQKKVLYDFESDTGIENKYSWDANSTEEDTAYQNANGAYFDYAFFKAVFWQEYSLIISEAINKYQIKVSPASEKDVSDLKKYGISINEKTETKDDFITIDYKIEIISETKGKKTVYHFSCKPDSASCQLSKFIWIRSFGIQGFFKSPFENRIAIIVFESTNGSEEAWEYPFLLGADLDKGFTNK